MLSLLLRFCLAFTSFTPALGALCIALYVKKGEDTLIEVRGQPLLIFFIVIIGLIGLCFWLIKRAESSKGSRREMVINEFDRRDKGATSFLFITVLPILRPPESLCSIGIYTVIYVAIIITASMVDIGAYNFNHVIRIAGYRCYEVKDEFDITHLLIVRKRLTRTKRKVLVNKISDDVWIVRKGHDNEL